MAIHDTVLRNTLTATGHPAYWPIQYDTPLASPLIGPLPGQAIRQLNRFSFIFNRTERTEFMSTPFRVASFNVENLFSRAKVLNLQDPTDVNDALKQIAELQALLKKAIYTPAVKAEILSLFGQVSTFIDIREHRGKLFTKSASGLKVTASGRGDWDGDIEFKRAKISEMARENTAKVFKSVKADLACIVEVENRPILQSFNSEGLDSKKFNFPMLIDGNDQRGIDVGLLSRFPIGTMQTHMFDKDSQGVIFSRDCLVVTVELPNGQPLTILCNHLKSKGFGSPITNDAKRKRQAERIKQILQGFNLSQDLVIVAGDMNDTPDSAALAPMLGVPNLFDVLELQFGTNMPARGTFNFSGQWNQIDFLLVSKPLKQAFQSAGVERRGIFKLNQLTHGAETPFPTVTSNSNAASDHAAIFADFSL